MRAPFIVELKDRLGVTTWDHDTRADAEEFARDQRRNNSGPYGIYSARVYSRAEFDAIAAAAELRNNSTPLERFHKFIGA